MALAAIAGIVGAGSQAIGAAKRGQAEQEAMAWNALWAEDQANAIERKTKLDEKALRTMGAKSLGAARVAVAASGITLEGSAMDVLEESAMNIELDALAIRHEGQDAAYGKRMEAMLGRQAGQAAGSAGMMSAASTLLSSGADLYNRFG